MKTVNPSLCKKSDGFTLIELMVTVAVAAILLTVGIPSFRDVLVGNRVESHQQDLLSSLNLARSEAVTRGVSIGVCGRLSATTCVNTDDWSAGWLIFIDDGAGGGTSGDAIRNGTEEILRNYDYQGSNEVLVDDSADPIYLAFNQRGYLLTSKIADGSDGDDRRVTMRICESGDNVSFARAVIVGQTGRVSKSYDLDGDNIFEDVSSVNLSC